MYRRGNDETKNTAHRLWAFWGEKIKPQWEAVKQLNGLKIEDIVFVAEQIPTVFKKSIKVLEELIERHRPELSDCCGTGRGKASYHTGKGRG